MIDASTDNWEQVKAESIAALPQTVVDHINSVLSLPNSESHLISTLHSLQNAIGFLGTTQLDAIAQLLQIPTAKVTGVATFYHYFRLKKTGRFIISVCNGTACYVKGEPLVSEAFTKALGIIMGETTPDELFTLENTRCLGVCGLAPCAMINNEIFAHLTPEKIPPLIESLRQKVNVK